jgi:hypothetical protein
MEKRNLVSDEERPFLLIEVLDSMFRFVNRRYQPMEWWRRTKAMALVKWPAHQWTVGIGLAVLMLEVLVIVLRGNLPTLLIFLLIDASGTLVGLWIVKTGRRKTKPGEQQSSSSSLREEMERAHFFLENDESRAEVAGIRQNHEPDRTRGNESTTRGLRLQREETKNDEDDMEALELLCHAGFTLIESDRLCKLRKRCAKQEGNDTLAEVSRLKFVRWLVATGKLTDQL